MTTFAAGDTDYIAKLNELAAGGAAQPLDSDLTAIAALSTTSYGRALLTLANAAALTAGVSTFVASGASHAAGLVPDPGASAGTAKFLREDATWAVVTSTPGYVLAASAQHNYLFSGAI